MVEDVKIPQRLQDQAEKVLGEALEAMLGEATEQEHAAELLKARYFFGLDSVGSHMSYSCCGV